MKTLLMFLLLVLSACATTPPSSQFSSKQGDQVEDLIRAGNSTKAIEEITKYPSITEADRFWLIYYSVNKQCLPEVVRTVLGKKGEVFEANMKKPKEDTFADRLQNIGDQLSGGPKVRSISYPEHPGAVLISTAGRNFCAEGFKMIADKVTAEDFAIGIYRKQKDFDSAFSDTMTPSFLEQFERVAIRDNETEERSQQILAIAKYSSNRIKEECSKIQGESCKAQEAFKKVGANMQAEASARDYAASPQGVLDEVCNSHAEMQNYLNLIREENEKGKISGYVNKVALKQMG
jgi:hypothetical protein